MMVPITGLPSTSPMAASAADGLSSASRSARARHVHEARVRRASRRTDRGVVEAERHLVELRRVGREERARSCLVRDPGDGRCAPIAVPDAHEDTSRPGLSTRNASRTRRLVRKEHEPELAHHRVERAIREGQARCRPPGATRARGRRGPRVRAWAIIASFRSVGDERALAGEAAQEAPGDDAGAAGDLQHAHHPRRPASRGQVVRVAVEEERSEVPVVVDRGSFRRTPRAARAIGVRPDFHTFGRTRDQRMEVKA